MIANETCVLVACDGCATPLGPSDDEGGGSWHFATVDKALESARECEWEVTDTTLTCLECIAKRLCDAEGHDWSEWWRCLCGSQNKEHRDGMTSEHRSCGRDYCYAFERRAVVGSCDHVGGHR